MGSQWATGLSVTLAAKNGGSPMADDGDYYYLEGAVYSVLSCRLRTERQKLADLTKIYNEQEFSGRPQIKLHESRK